jgi:hypothetical protein
MEELRLFLAGHGRVPELAGEREPDSHEGDDEKNGQVGETGLRVILRV